MPRIQSPRQTSADGVCEAAAVAANTRSEPAEATAADPIPFVEVRLAEARRTQVHTVFSSIRLAHLPDK